MPLPFCRATECLREGALRMKIEKRAVCYWLVALIAVMGGCEKKAVQLTETVFYPEAPDPPRLQFLTSFSNAQEWAGKSGGSFSDFIVGAKKVVKGEISQPYGVGARDGKLYICDLGIRRVHVIDVLNKSYKVLGGGGS